MNAARSVWLVGLAAVLLAGCQTAPKPAQQGEEAQYSFPAEAYDGSAEGRVYRLDAAASQVRVLVYRGGSLAAAGHNHVIVPGEIRGAVRLPGDGIDGAWLDIAVPLSSLQVDPTEARAAVGGSFAGEVPAEDRRGTRANMLGSDGLDAERFPTLGLRVREVAGELPRPILQLQVFLHGRRQTITVPVVAHRDDGTLRAEGRFAIRQSAFGVEPFSALGGALRVQDYLVVEFQAVARAES